MVLNVTRISVDRPALKGHQPVSANLVSGSLREQNLFFIAVMNSEDDESIQIQFPLKQACKGSLFIGCFSLFWLVR